jgi:hypothetical protein
MTATRLLGAIAFTWLSPHPDPLGGLVAAAMLVAFPLLAGAAADLPVALAALAACLSAPGAEIVIRIDHRANSVLVEVRNEAPPYGAAEATGSGHGLRGMTERVSGCGGTLRAAATAGGGFQVRAVLPRVVQA